jgi:hypothetical protein
MEFVRLDTCHVLRKERGGRTPEVLRLVVPSQVITKEMVRTTPTAAPYAPITILVDAR